MNTGDISGAGTLYVVETDDVSDYDDGIEYYYSDTNRPDDYSRNMFVRDPAETVDVIYYLEPV